MFPLHDEDVPTGMAAATDLLTAVVPALQRVLGRGLTAPEWYHVMNRCESICEVPEDERSNYAETDEALPELTAALAGLWG